MKVFTFSMIAPLFFISAPAQIPSSKYSLAINQVETVSYDKKANEKRNPLYFSNELKSKRTARINFGYASARKDEKGNSIPEISRTGKCKCAGCILLTDARIAIPGEQKTTYKHRDIKAGETVIRYPEGSAYGKLLKELTLKWM